MTRAKGTVYFHNVDPPGRPPVFHRANPGGAFYSSGLTRCGLTMRPKRPWAVLMPATTARLFGYGCANCGIR